MTAEITIYDIARKLHLSASTVSRALANNPRIKKQTRETVQLQALALGYSPNSVASNLRTNKTNTIGLLIHEINSQFMTNVIAGIEEETAAAGYDLLIALSSEQYKKEKINANNLFRKRVDALIASLSIDTESLSHFDQFIEKSIPVAFFDRVDHKLPGIKVIIDNKASAMAATEHLVAQGCRRIVHVTTSLTRNVYAERLAGFTAALKKHGLPFNDQSVIIKDFKKISAGEEAAQEILSMQPRPDGIFVSNDQCAGVCIHALLNAGVKVPEEIVVAGFNNDIISRITDPQITTIEYPGRDIGRTVARLLLKQLRGDQNISSKVVYVPWQLVARASSLRALPG
jgi:LacI family transcriptional regulator